MNSNDKFTHLDTLALPIAVAEESGRIAFANGALEALMGVPRARIQSDWLLLEIAPADGKAADQNAVNKELLRNLAHEIKNPLGGIRGAAQLLQMDLSDKSLIEYTQVIIHEADRLQSLVDRLLAPHRQPHILGTVNIHEICERVRQLILVEFPHGLTVVRDYDASIPEFQGDREQLIQALLNVAHNAAQALEERIQNATATLTFKTRIARQVLLGKVRHKLALQLHVIDNGPGIPEEIKDRIFFPLVTGRAGGSGLGLSLAQNFVQQHAGLIECDSVPGRTDFKIVIPLQAGSLA
ncbi:MAG: nitrogen regulation protein NR(II) [Cytophagales bacterium]|nr:nitrogen regulation protein NR(II) [Cytophagales bacterium]